MSEGGAELAVTFSKTRPLSGASSGGSYDSDRYSSRPSSASTSASSSTQPSKKHSKVSKYLHLARSMPKRVVCSISFIVLALATCAAVIPAIIIWFASVSSGLNKLQQNFLQESIERRAVDVKLNVELNLGGCEDQMLGLSEYVSALLVDRDQDEPDLDFILNKTLVSATLLTPHHGCGRLFVMIVNDGGYGIILGSVWGSLLGVQRGLGTAGTLTLYIFDMDNFTPNWMYGFTYPGASAIDIVSVVANSTMKELITGVPLVWTPFSVKYKTGVYSGMISADLVAPITDPTTNFLRGFMQISMTDIGFGFLFKNQTNEDGIICTFIQDTLGCLLSSSCETASLYVFTPNVTRVCTHNSSISEVRTSYSVLLGTLGTNVSSWRDNGTVVITQGDLAFGFSRIKTPHGFIAISTVIAGISTVFRDFTF